MTAIIVWFQTQLIEVRARAAEEADRGEIVEKVIIVAAAAAIAIGEGLLASPLQVAVVVLGFLLLTASQRLRARSAARRTSAPRRRGRIRVGA